MRPPLARNHDTTCPYLVRHAPCQPPCPAYQCCPEHDDTCAPPNEKAGTDFCCPDCPNLDPS